MSRLFISHSSRDSFEALAVREWLVAEGWSGDDIFLDLHGIGAGARWKEALAKANERCEAVLFLISPHSLASNECYVELRMAEDMGKVILPAIVPPRVPEDRLTIDDQRLAMHRERQIVDASIEPREAAFTVEHEGQRRTIAFHAPTLARIKARLDHLGISPNSFAWTPGDLDTATPYPGLGGFSQGEAALFFGRAGDIARGFASLRKLRRAALNGGQGALLVIQAASGAGKSSFLKAGLWPRLARDPDFTPIGILRPATGILTGDTGVGRQLSAFFARHNRPRPATEIHQALRGTIVEAEAALRALIVEATAIGREPQRLANPDAPPPMPVIAVDQAEELFAADDAEESRRFLSLLAGLMGTSGATVAKLSPPPLFVWTIRADSMDTLLHATTAHDLGAPELFPLPPIPRTSFAEIINGPLAVANRAGMRLAIDPLLTQKLIEVSDGADALPLLAYTLRQLVEDNRAGAKAQISLEAFETGGGIGGVLRKRLAAAQRKAGADDVRLRSLFVPRLATWDADARPPGAKRLVADEADLFAGERAALKPLAEALVGERLLTRGGDEGGRTTLEVAHEALLRQPPLSEWLEEAREFLVWRDGVGRARRGFEANTRPHLMGRELEIARGWLQGTNGADIAAEDQGFIQASLAAEERTRSEAAERERQRQAAELEAARAREQAAQEAAKGAQERAKAARHVARRTFVGLAASLILALIAAGLGFFAMERTATAERERGEARKQADLAKIAATRAVETRNDALLTQSKYLADAALQVLERDKNPGTAMLLALEALRDTKSNDEAIRNRPYWPRAEVALEAARRAFMERGLLKGHESAVLSVAWSPDGRWLATGSDDKTVRLWQWPEGSGDWQPGPVLKGPESAVQSVAWSPDGRWLATGSDDSTVRLWQRPEGGGDWQPGPVLKGHADTVWSVAWSPDGRWLATGFGDKTVRLWQRPEGGGTWQLGAVLKGHEGAVHSVAWSPDGRWLATGSGDNTVRLWQRPEGAGDWQPGPMLKGHESWVRSVAWSPDGRWLATGSGDKTVRLWQRPEGGGDWQPGSVLKGHESWVQSVAWSPDGRWLATGSGDKTVRLWQRPKGGGDWRSEPVLKGHADTVSSVAWSPDGHWLANGSGDKMVRLWQRPEGGGDWQPGSVLKGQENRVTSAAWSPDGRRLATGSGDSTVRLWQQPEAGGDWQPGAALKGHEKIVNSVAWSPDGRWLATGSDDKAVRLWQRPEGAGDWQSGPVLKGDAGTVRSVAWSPDGRWLATGSGDKTVRLWQRPEGGGTWQLGAVLKGHEGAVHSVAWSPDGRRLATGSGDNTVRLWQRPEAGGDWQPGTVLKGHAGTVLSVAWSPDGRWLATGSTDTTMRLWPIFASGQALIDEAKALIPRCLTEAQRQTYHLAPTPPGWCHSLQKWPNDALTSARAHMAARRWREAIVAFEALLASDARKAADHWQSLAHAHNSIAWAAVQDVTLRGKQASAAKEVLPDAERAVALAPEDRNILDTRGHLLLALGRTEDALADFDKAIANGANFPGAFYGRGRAHELKGNRDAAVADYRKALEMKAQDNDWGRHVVVEARARLAALGAPVPEAKPEPK